MILIRIKGLLQEIRMKFTDKLLDNQEDQGVNHPLNFKTIRAMITHLYVELAKADKINRHYKVEQPRISLKSSQYFHLMNLDLILIIIILHKLTESQQFRIMIIIMDLIIRERDTMIQ